MPGCRGSSPGKLIAVGRRAYSAAMKKVPRPLPRPRPLTSLSAKGMPPVGKKFDPETTPQIRAEIHHFAVNRRRRMHRNPEGLCRLYANPYNPSAHGFYFQSLEEFEAGMEKLKRRGVEEVEIDFIDGPEWCSDLFRALQIAQHQVKKWFEVYEQLDETEAAKLYGLIEYHGAGYLEGIDFDDVYVMQGTLQDWAYDQLESFGFPMERVPGSKSWDPKYEPNWSYFDFEQYWRGLETELDDDTVEEVAHLDGDQEKVEYLWDNQIVAPPEGEDLNLYFDAEKYGRDADLNGEVDEFTFAGHDWVMTGHTG